jgi:homogentisate phytyltransferase/homogentisate geranylgeranyltransferase
MIYAMIPALLMNLYITGLNQITDVEIDKINKPNLPMASGELSFKGATITVVLSLVMSLVFGVAGSQAFATEGLNMALGMSALLGTLYSLPPFRLKRFPLLAAFCIVSVRGAVINAGFFAHARVAAYGTSAIAGVGGAAAAASSSTLLQCLWKDPRCTLSSLYFAVFGLVIALMKDVPDIKGDALSNIRTVSVRLGAKTVYKTMHRLLTGLFWAASIAFFRGAIVANSSISTTATVAVRVGRAVVGVAALLAGASVQREATPVDPENPKEVYDFYMHLWKLFYLSYFFLPLAR